MNEHTQSGIYDLTQTPSGKIIRKLVVIHYAKRFLFDKIKFPPTDLMMQWIEKDSNLIIAILFEVIAMSLCLGVKKSLNSYSTDVMLYNKEHNDC